MTILINSTILKNMSELKKQTVLTIKSELKKSKLLSNSFNIEYYYKNYCSLL